MCAMYSEAWAVVLIASTRHVEYRFFFIIASHERFRLEAEAAMMKTQLPPAGNLQREANPVGRRPIIFKSSAKIS